jgi:hypothetical protein
MLQKLADPWLVVGQTNHTQNLNSAPNILNAVCLKRLKRGNSQLGLKLRVRSNLVCDKVA